MKLVCIDKIDSTHIYLCDNIRTNKIKDNFAIYALEQNNGIGSRDNSWDSLRGNLHLSFCIKQNELSNDIPTESMSIYFAYIFKELLAIKGSNIWLKWPNDFYIEDKKIGGIISSKINDFIIVGIGLNIKYAPINAGFLDINIDLDCFIKEYLLKCEKKILWKDIFKKYVLEFEKSKVCSFYHKDKKLSLSNALLYEDGSILLENKRIYSLR